MDSANANLPDPFAIVVDPIQRGTLLPQISEAFNTPLLNVVSELIKGMESEKVDSSSNRLDQVTLPQSVLLEPMMEAPMIESPQMSSSTGRGRSRGGSSNTRKGKPRQKKSNKQLVPRGNGNVDTADINSTITSTNQLSVSEDCVTQVAARATDVYIDKMNDVHEEGSQDCANELDTSNAANSEKPKKSKTRSRKESKESKGLKDRKKKKKIKMS